MTAQPSRPSGTLDVFLVAAEESGDRLGAALMRALRERTGRGGALLRGRRPRDGGRGGGEPLFDRRFFDHRLQCDPAADPENPASLMRFTAKAVLERRPDVLVVIDSPGFTRGIARRVRAAEPTIPIVEYVSPSVWAWRPGRARVMRAYIDHILALLPFEPDVHRRLGGPPCTYVGHPWSRRSASFVRTPRKRAAGSPRRRSCWFCREAGPARSSACWRFLPTPWRWSGTASGRSRSWCRRCRTWSLRSRRRRRNGRCGRASWSRRPRSRRRSGSRGPRSRNPAPSRSSSRSPASRRSEPIGCRGSRLSWGAA